jgi:hypothetical protein
MEGDEGDDKDDEEGANGGTTDLEAWNNSGETSIQFGIAANKLIQYRW